MNEWKEWSAELPPVGQLVLINFGDFYPVGLRSRTEDGALYDENEIYDDSEIEPLSWHPIPAENSLACNQPTPKVSDDRGQEHE